jgi:hypothetical protein
MNTTFVRLVSRLLIVCMLGLPFSVNAALVGTDQIVSAAQALAARDRIATVIDRTEVARQLQAFGLAPDTAKDRLNALTDSEVAQLAGRIDSMPTGAAGTGVVVLILVALLIWWVWK